MSKINNFSHKIIVQVFWGIFVKFLMASKQKFATVVFKSHEIVPLNNVFQKKNSGKSSFLFSCKRKIQLQNIEFEWASFLLIF
jgi:hypothetical protein